MSTMVFRTSPVLFSLVITYVTISFASDITPNTRLHNQPDAPLIPTAQETVDLLLHRLVKSQYNHTVNRTFNLRHIYEHNVSLFEFGGLWESFIRFNVNGKLWEMRDKISIPDSNMFATGWVLELLLDDIISSFMSLNSSMSDSNLTETFQSMSHPALIAVQALSQFQDRNSAASMSDDSTHTDDSSTNMRMSFWLQKYNERCGDYCAYPTNLMDPMTNTLNHSAAIIAISQLLLGDGKVAAGFLESVEGFVRAFGVPADVDDTSLTASLSVSLYNVMSNRNDSVNKNDDNSSPFEEASEWWFENVAFAKNFASFADNVKRYAYRPFSGLFDNSIIDTRTFYWLRGYLYELQANLTENELKEVAFIATWFQNETEMMRNDREHVCYQTPLSVNNMDASVVSNVLYGLLRSLEWSVNVGNGADDWFDDEMQSIYQRNLDLMIWIIDQDWLSKRPDILLTYYPPRLNLYWFISRIYALLSNTNSDTVQSLLQSYPMFNDIRASLETALKGSVTDKLHSLIENDAPGEIETVGQFWSDFLGQGDEPIAHCDDCLYTTGVASLTLMNIWSDCVRTEGSSGECDCHNTHLIEDTPASIRGDLANAYAFLKYYSVNDEGNQMQPNNAFFSGSINSNTTMPWFYPANVWHYSSGRSLDPTMVDIYDVNANLCCGVEEVMDDITYQERMEMEPCGYPTPVSFPGYNYGGAEMVFWAAPPVTYAIDLLAVAQYSCTVETL